MSGDASNDLTRHGYPSRVTGWHAADMELAAALADLARAQSTIAAVRALCDEMETWPVQTPKAIALHLRRVLDGTTEGSQR